MTAPPPAGAPGDGRAIGRYRIFGEIAAGGMATVHVGRLVGPAGFSRTVAIKRLHPQFAKDPDFVAMFLDEARLAARIRHPNVVSTLDVVALETELFLVMDYVQGESLSRLLRAAVRDGQKPPPRVVSSIVIQSLLGLHAAHEAVSDRGEPLGLVHRDVSPQNILVGTDGVARVVDFGVAKAASRAHTTQEGQLKGKLGYMAPEQLTDGEVDRRADVFTTGIVLWEALTGQRLFVGNDPASGIAKILHQAIPPPSRFVPQLTPEADHVVLQALDKNPRARYATAREMAAALERAIPPAGALEVGAWVEQNAKPALDERARKVQEIESISSSLDVLEMRQQFGAGAPSAPVADGESRSGLTELSSAAAKSLAAPPPPKRTRLVLLAIALVLGSVLSLVLLVLVVRAQRNETPGDVAPVVPAVSPPPTPPTVLASSPAPLEAAPPSASASASSAASAAPRSRITPAPAPAGAKKPVQSKPPAAKANCDPPYVIDATGAKRFKPECF